jgi:hypothetical protein
VSLAASAPPRHAQHLNRERGPLPTAAAAARSPPPSPAAPRSYKAHFRWKHYTSELAGDVERPAGTEACASVTSAFLQVLATVHAAESARARRPRNVLRILATNTRRTKVVELSSGTHRVADELRRHSLPDGGGGHYSTNLDRNRYGADNNYLFTVARFNLECLGLCPCLVDIEIVDTRAGNESQLVTAGPGACSCASAERAELADVSHLAASALRGASPPRDAMRRAASAGNLAAAMRRGGGAAGAGGVRRAPSNGRLFEAGGGGGGGGGGPGRSQVSNGGSELFDALLLAATGDHEVRSGGEPPVSSRHARKPGQAPGARGWARGASAGDLQAMARVDSLQNAVDAFRGGAPGGGAAGGGGAVGAAANGGAPHGAPGGAGADDADAERLGSAARARARMPRRNSVSMIDNPMLAQAGGADSLLVGQYFPSYQHLAALMAGGGGANTAEGGGGGGADSGEGDTGDDGPGGGGGGGDGALRARLLGQFQKQHSAANLAHLGAGAAAALDGRRADEARALREQQRGLEAGLEEARSALRAAEAAAADAESRGAANAAAARAAADAAAQLRAALAAAGAPDPTAGAPVPAPALAAAEAEISALRAELAEARAAAARAAAERRETDAKLRAVSATAAALARAGAPGHLPPLPPPGALPLNPYAMLPMFGMPPLNPYGGMPAASPPRPPAPPGAGAMHKVASAPAIHAAAAADAAAAAADAAAAAAARASPGAASPAGAPKRPAADVPAAGELDAASLAKRVKAEAADGGAAPAPAPALAATAAAPPVAAPAPA